MQAAQFKIDTSFESAPYVRKFSLDQCFCNKVADLWEQWVRIASREIRANFAIDDERIGLPFSIEETTLLAHYKQKMPVQTQKLDASIWALRRTQEAVARWARSTLSLNQLKNIAFQNAKALIALEDKNLIHFGQSLAQDLMQDARNPSISTLKTLRAWVELIKAHMDGLAKQAINDAREKWQTNAKREMAAGSSWAYRHIKGGTLAGIEPITEADRGTKLEPKSPTGRSFTAS